MNVKEKEQQREACNDTVMPMIRHCRTLCIGGCRGTETSTRWENMLLFKVEDHDKYGNYTEK
jgi:hypothetical protein